MPPTRLDGDLHYGRISSQYSRRDLETLDPNKDGVLTERERTGVDQTKLQEAIDKLSANHRDVVTADDLNKDLHYDRIDSDYTQRDFKAVDPNDDGVITRSEFAGLSAPDQKKVTDRYWGLNQGERALVLADMTAPDLQYGGIGEAAAASLMAELRRLDPNRDGTFTGVEQKNLSDADRTKLAEAMTKLLADNIPVDVRARLLNQAARISGLEALGSGVFDNNSPGQVMVRNSGGYMPGITRVAAGNKADRGYIEIYTAPTRDGFRLTVDSYHTGANEALTYMLQAEVLDTTTNQMRTVTLTVLTHMDIVNPESYNGTRTWSLKYNEINDYLAAQYPGLRVNPGTTRLFVTALWAGSGHRAGGPGRGAFITPVPVGQTAAQVNQVSGTGARSADDMPLDLEIAYPKELLDQFPMLMREGAIVSRLESEFKAMPAVSNPAASYAAMSHATATLNDPNASAADKQQARAALESARQAIIGDMAAATRAMEGGVTRAYELRSKSLPYVTALEQVEAAQAAIVALRAEGKPTTDAERDLQAAQAALAAAEPGFREVETVLGPGWVVEAVDRYWIRTPASAAQKWIEYATEKGATVDATRANQAFDDLRTALEAGNRQDADTARSQLMRAARGGNQDKIRKKIKLFEQSVATLQQAGNIVGTGEFEGFIVDSRGWPMPDPYTDEYGDTADLVMTNLGGVQRLRSNNAATFANYKGAGLLDPATGIRQRIEIGHRLQEGATTTELAELQRGLSRVPQNLTYNQADWTNTVFNHVARHMEAVAPGVDLGQETSDWLEITQTRHKFTLRNVETGVEEEVSFDFIKVKTLRPEHFVNGQPVELEYVIVEGELNHLQINSQNQQQYAASSATDVSAFLNDEQQEGWFEEVRGGRTATVTVDTPPQGVDVQDNVVTLPERTRGFDVKLKVDDQEIEVTIPRRADSADAAAAVQAHLPAGYTAQPVQDSQGKVQIQVVQQRNLTMDVEPELHGMNHLHDPRFRQTTSYKAFEEVNARAMRFFFPGGTTIASQKANWSGFLLGLGVAPAVN